MRNPINTKKVIYIIITFLIALLPRLYYVFQAIPIRTMSDELSTIYGAAKLAGFNWKEVVSNAGYYGYGFYSLLFPVFKMIDNPIWIYRIILFTVSLLQASVSLICFFICDRYLEVNDDINISLISILTSYAVVTRTTIAYNEHPLILISWIIVLLICKILSSKKKVYLALLFLTLGFSLLIHSRAIVLFIITIVVLFLFGIAIKDRIIRWGWIIFAISLYLEAKILNHLYQKDIWGNTNNIRNASVNIKVNDIRINLSTLKAWCNIVFGQIETLNIFLSGMIMLILTMIVYKAYTDIKSRQIETDIPSKIIFLISSIFILCIGAMIFAQSLSWLSGVADGVENSIPSEDNYSYKAFTYVRYFGPYIAPVVMCGLVLIIKYIEEAKKKLVVSTIMVTCLHLYWMANILSYVQNNGNASEVFLPFSRAKILDSINQELYLKGMIISINIFFICLFLIRKNKKRIFLGIITISLIYQYCYSAKYYDIASQKENFKNVDASYSFIKSIKNKLPSGYYKTMYVWDGRETKDHQTYYQYQFYFYDSEIKVGIPENGQDSIILSNREIADKLDKHYICYELDDNEYVYFYGDKLIEKIEMLDMSNRE